MQGCITLLQGQLHSEKRPADKVPHFGGSHINQSGAATLLVTIREWLKRLLVRAA